MRLGFGEVARLRRGIQESTQDFILGLDVSFQRGG